MSGEMVHARRRKQVEERKSVRSSLLILEVKGRHYNKIFIGYAKNISKDGLFLDARQTLKPGDRFPVEFILPDATTKIICTCEVVWTKRYNSAEGGSCGLGVRFVKMDESQKKIIDEWVTRTVGRKKVGGNRARRQAVSKG